jgi:hypothetical protein
MVYLCPIILYFASFQELCEEFDFSWSEFDQICALPDSFASDFLKRISAAHESCCRGPEESDQHADAKVDEDAGKLTTKIISTPTASSSSSSSSEQQLCPVWVSPWYPCDAYAMACLLFQEETRSRASLDTPPESVGSEVAHNPFVAEARDVHASIELSGTFARGALAVDWYGGSGRTPNVRLITKIRRNMMFDLMMQHFAK